MFAPKIVPIAGTTSQEGHLYDEGPVGLSSAPIRRADVS